MKHLAPPLERLIQELSRLPSIGKKTAQRLAFHLLRIPREEAEGLARSIVELRERIGFCSVCFNLAEGDLCPICVDSRRDLSLLCVVEEPTNLISLERTGVFSGLYHVLGGSLSPMRDVGPEDLHIEALLRRVAEGAVEEVILATNANVEGEATAVYLSRLLEPSGVRRTRLAQGLPAGGDLEYTDDLTLRRALEGRRSF